MEKIQKNLNISNKNTFIPLKKKGETFKASAYQCAEISFFDSFKHSKIAEYQYKKNKKNQKDILLESPLRMLGYTNEVGEALHASIGRTAANFFWVPALMYFGADIWDKYKRGEDDSYQNNDGKSALRQAVFHTVASLVVPTMAIHAAQKGLMKAGGETWINKTLENITQKNSTLAAKIKRIPLAGEKLLSSLRNPAGGKKLLTGIFKTVVGLATLALVAIPLDILTEKILIKKVVNPVLGLKDHNKNPFDSIS